MKITTLITLSKILVLLAIAGVVVSLAMHRRGEGANIGAGLLVISAVCGLLAGLLALWAERAADMPFIAAVNGVASLALLSLSALLIVLVGYGMLEEM